MEKFGVVGTPTEEPKAEMELPDFRKAAADRFLGRRQTQAKDGTRCSANPDTSTTSTAVNRN
jgi:hypothetical protein